MTIRIIIEAEPSECILAVRAARWLIDQPKEQKDAILAYANGCDFYVRRNKASILARQLPRRAAA